MIHADSEVIQAILERNAKKLHEILVSRGIITPAKTVEPQNAAKTIKECDLQILFGVEKNMCCIFHIDHQPSASVFKGKSGDWLYCCHASDCRCGGKTMNLFQVTQILQGSDSKTASSFLLQAFGIKPRKHCAAVNLFDYNLDLIQSGKLKQLAPTVVKIIDLKALIALYQFGKKSLPPIISDAHYDHFEYSMSNNQFKKILGKPSFLVSNFLGEAAYLHLITRIPLYSFTQKRYQKIKPYLLQNKGKLPVNQIQVLLLTENQLSLAEQAAKEWISKKYTVTSFNYQTVRTLEDSWRAHECFPCGDMLQGIPAFGSGGSCDDLLPSMADAVKNIIDEADCGKYLEEIRKELIDIGFSKRSVRSDLPRTLRQLNLEGYSITREGRKKVVNRKEETAYSLISEP